MCNCSLAEWHEVVQSVEMDNFVREVTTEKPVETASVKFASQHTGKITVLRHFCLVLQTVFFARLTIDWSHF